MRVSLGPGEVAGYFSRLKRGFAAAGVHSEHFLLAPDPYRYSDQDYFLADGYRAVASLRESSNALVRMTGRLGVGLIKLMVFVYALVRCDVFIFSGFETFFRLHDLRLLKLLGKKVIVVFLGTDARPPIFSGRHVDDEAGLVDSAAALAEARDIRRRVSIIERYADHIVNHTGTDQFFTREYVRFAAIGLPVEPIDVEPAPPRQRLKIVHAPSRPVAKGSHVFRAILDELKLEGYAFDYVELVKVPNKRVLEELASCDFVIDELYSDVRMAMFATEAAMFGKPAVIGSHYAADYDAHNPDPEHPPSAFGPPEKIKEIIRKLLDDDHYRSMLGARAREFVRNSWTPAAVAQRFVDLVDGRAPASWFSRPADHDYIWGWGLSRTLWAAQVRPFVSRFGPEGLLFDHNPRLIIRVTEALEQISEDE